MRIFNSPHMLHRDLNIQLNRFAQLAAIAPPITFAFIFNYLLVITQRNADRQLKESLALAESSNEKEKDTAGFDAP